MIEDELVVVNCRSCEKCVGGKKDHFDINDFDFDFRSRTEGLHMRPAMELVHLMNQYQCEVDITDVLSGNCVDGKSIIQMSMLGATTGSVVKLRYRGVDEISARDAFADAFVSGFGEELCPDFVVFRRSYAVEQGFSPDEFRRLSNCEVLKAYSAALKQGRVCIGKQRLQGKDS